MRLSDALIGMRELAVWRSGTTIPGNLRGVRDVEEVGLPTAGWGEHSLMTMRTPLYADQLNAGAKFIDFGGWDMPVQFTGITAEHTAVRQRCGVFDVSHMGRLHVTGDAAGMWLNRIVCRRCDDLNAGQVRYGLILAADGGTIDDVLVARESATAFHIVVNAGNRTAVLAHLQQHEQAGVTVHDLSAEQAMIAVQGPQSVALLASLGLDPSPLKNYRFRDVVWRNVSVRISRTGYTGEDGAELFAPAAAISGLWQAVVATGAAPCGLGARDTLRMEAAMPLYGHELDRATSPIAAGLAFAVNPAGGFIGAERVLREQAGGADRVLVGVVVPSKRVPRQGYPVMVDSTTVGVITSGTLSPTLGQAIGMAYVDHSHATPGTALAIDLRGTLVPATVVALPFYRRQRAG